MVRSPQPRLLRSELIMQEMSRIYSVSVWQLTLISLVPALITIKLCALSINNLKVFRRRANLH